MCARPLSHTRIEADQTVWGKDGHVDNLATVEDAQIGRLAVLACQRLQIRLRFGHQAGGLKVNTTQLQSADSDPEAAGALRAFNVAAAFEDGEQAQGRTRGQVEPRA